MAEPADESNSDILQQLVRNTKARGHEPGLFFPTYLAAAHHNLTPPSPTPILRSCDRRKHTLPQRIAPVASTNPIPRRKRPNHDISVIAQPLQQRHWRVFILRNSPAYKGNGILRKAPKYHLRRHRIARHPHPHIGIGILRQLLQQILVIDVGRHPTQPVDVPRPQLPEGARLFSQPQQSVLCEKEPLVNSDQIVANHLVQPIAHLITFNLLLLQISDQIPALLRLWNPMLMLLSFTTKSGSLSHLSSVVSVHAIPEFFNPGE
jgi:hypothetical protein